AWADTLGASARREVLVLAESGEDDPKRAQASAAPGWHGLLALGTTRRVTAAARPWTTPTSQPWGHLATVCRRHRRRQGHPRRLATPGHTRPRRDVRVRRPAGAWRSVGQVELVGSARHNRPEGRRTSLAGHALRATTRQSGRGYRRRWAVEL